MPPSPRRARTPWHFEDDVWRSARGRSIRRAGACARLTQLLKAYRNVVDTECEAAGPLATCARRLPGSDPIALFSPEQSADARVGLPDTNSEADSPNLRHGHPSHCKLTERCGGPKRSFRSLLRLCSSPSARVPDTPPRTNSCPPYPARRPSTPALRGSGWPEAGGTGPCGSTARAGG